jgi:ubiquinone/menaquinone biosynthesis C-methylase UbiE
VRDLTFEELKAKQSVVWGAAPFERVAETSADAHDHVVEVLGVTPGERWLDLATGTGAVAVRAARRGASVTGVDFAPVLIDTARRLAAEEGIDIEYEVGDAENLRFDDGSFDVVSSTFGVMFAPDHEAVAAELARVTRQGGRMGLACWRPDGGVADLFRLMAPFQPPPLPGAGVPFDWGREEHVTELLGEAFELDFHEGDSPQVGESGEEIWELFSTSYGPTKTLADSLTPERREELHRTFVDYYEGHRANGGIHASRPYLVTLGHRR